VTRTRRAPESKALQTRKSKALQSTASAKQIKAMATA